MMITARPALLQPLQPGSRAAAWRSMQRRMHCLYAWARLAVVTVTAAAHSHWALAAAPVQPALTLASHYHPQLDLQAYWVSEKYDGIRAHWTGHTLISRQGHPIDAPPWFTQNWPQQPLDGELWAGRNQFAAVQSAVAQGAAPDTAWRTVRYMVFDTPHTQAPFAQRQQMLAQAVHTIAQPWVLVAPQWQVDNHAALMRQLRQYTQAGAEGLMLRHAQAPYRGGRSQDLIKVKLFEDAEAVVRAHIPGQGKYRGATGALLVETSSGQHLKIGSGLSDADRRHPPAIGSTITYRYNGTHPSGLPRFARFWRARDVQHATSSSSTTPAPSPPPAHSTASAAAKAPDLPSANVPRPSMP